MSDILEQIAAHKRTEIEVMKRERPIESLHGSPEETHLSFREALSSPAKVKVIAELKKASPSKGVLIEEFDPEDLAARYRRGGASALSVLTEQKYFQGRLEYMQIAKQSARLPILCKDFIVDPYQIALASHYGADAILLIGRLLTRKTLADFMSEANRLGLDCLVEVHDENELEIALEAGAKIIGVNSRNLQTFEVDLSIAERLGKAIPDDRIKVAESGVATKDDITRLRQSGYSCFLIGEALVKCPNPTALLQELISE